MPRVRVRAWIDLGPRTLLGPGRATLLAAIAAAGSISAAGRTLGMSYRRAWTLVQTMNDAAPRPLVERTTGGAGGGGARLTPLGRLLVDAFQQLEAELAAHGRRVERRLATALRRDADLGESAGARHTGGRSTR